MKTVLKILAVLVVGTLLGLAATWLVVFRGGPQNAVHDGPWTTNLTVGSSNTDIYTRAAVAIHGLLALNRGETIYYAARGDSEGNRFDGRCTYLIVGRDPPARWWAITAYAMDDYLIPNPVHRYSVSKNSVTRDASGEFVTTVSPKPFDRDWIPVAGAPFLLTLRLYNPAASVAADPAHVALPAIKKVSCP